MSRQWSQNREVAAARVGRASTMARRWWQIAREEAQEIHPRLTLANLLLAPLPIYVGSRLRAYCLRLAGFQIGRSTVIWGTPRISGRGDLYRRLQVGNQCWINIDCFFDLGAAVTIGDRVALGHQVMILTTTHTIGSAWRRAAAPQVLPVTIGDGAWLGSRCTVLPGVTIGAGAVVAAGAMVNRDVPPNTLVAGVPARMVRKLD